MLLAVSGDFEESKKKKKKKKTKRRSDKKKTKKKKKRKKEEKADRKKTRPEKKKLPKVRDLDSVESRKSRSKSSDQPPAGSFSKKRKITSSRNFYSKRKKNEEQEPQENSIAEKAKEAKDRADLESKVESKKRKLESSSNNRATKRRRHVERNSERSVESPDSEPAPAPRILVEAPSPPPPVEIVAQKPESKFSSKPSKSKAKAPKPLDKEAPPVKIVVKSRQGILKRNPLRVATTRWKSKNRLDPRKHRRKNKVERRNSKGSRERSKEDRRERRSEKEKQVVKKDEDDEEKPRKSDPENVSEPEADKLSSEESEKEEVKISPEADEPEPVVEPIAVPEVVVKNPINNARLKDRKSSYTNHQKRSKRDRRDDDRSRRDDDRRRRPKRKRRSRSRSSSRDRSRRRRRKRSPSRSYSSSSSRSRSDSYDRRRRRRGRRGRRRSRSSERTRRKRKKRDRKSLCPEWLRLAVEAFAQECTGQKHLSRDVRDFNKQYCRNLTRDIPFISQEMSTMAKLQLMSRLKAPYTQSYHMKFPSVGMDMNHALALLLKNNAAQANLTANVAQRGLAGLLHPEETLRNQEKKQKVEEKPKKAEKQISRSTSKSSASESSETSETEETEKTEPKKAPSAPKETPESPTFLPSPTPRKADDTNLDEELKKLQEEKRKVEEAERLKQKARQKEESKPVVEPPPPVIETPVVKPPADPPSVVKPIKTEKKKKNSPKKKKAQNKSRKETKKKQSRQRASTPTPQADEESSSEAQSPSSPQIAVISRIDELLQTKKRQQMEGILAKHNTDPNMEKSQQKLISMKKLMLFLDVDHTLLHATKNPKAIEHTQNPILKQSIHKIEFPNPNNCPYYVKLRPGVEAFLQNAAENYNIVLYTMGFNDYAQIVRRLMDPVGDYIRAIISREEHVNRRGEGGKKSIQEFIPLYDSNTIIVDDVDKVWEKPENVLTVPRYSFWPENESDGDAMWAAKALEKKEQDFTLRNISHLLSAVHDMWYRTPKPILSAPRLLDQMAKAVLHGCELVFTGIIPQQAVVEQNHIWKMAIKFGAKCSKDITETTTHVVADRRVTAKVQMGNRNPRLSVVHVNWLHQSVAQFVRADEKHFAFSRPAPPLKAHSDKKLEILKLRKVSGVDNLIDQHIAAGT